jgi:hypothetical protein
MSVVGRIMMIAIAYILACVAASTVVTIGALTPQWNDVASLGVPSAVIWSVVAVGAAVIVSLAALPALLVIALAEGFAWRSVLVYAALGGVLGLALCYGLDFAGYVGEPDYLTSQRQVIAAAGIAGGLVYWLFAGRKAGFWK